jgi:hypothetical protein
MIMPFTEEFFEVYEMLKERFCDDFDFIHAGDDISTQQNIIKDIVQMIYEADVVIADLTEKNVNVFYELGIAHTLNKKVIVISQHLEELPFDIRSYRATEYSTNFKKFDNLIKQLTKYLYGVKDGSIVFGNPVTDFMSANNSQAIPKTFEIDNPHNELGDMGYIDHLADIEEEMKGIINSLTELTKDMETMSAGIDACSNDIKRVKNSSGGSVSASFLRSSARKTASIISVYNKSQKEHNELLMEKWLNIEKNCLQLLGTEYAREPENIESLKELLRSQHQLKEAVLTTKNTTASFIKSFVDLRGAQSSLNKAVNSLEIDTKQFINFLEQICASIDRIRNKSKFVVGDIDYAEAPID